MPKASVDVDCGCSKDNKTSSFIFAALWLLGRLVYIRGVSDFNAKSGRKLVSKLDKMFKCTQANFICCCVCSLILLGLGAQGLIAPPRVCQPDDPCIQVSCDWWRDGHVTRCCAGGGEDGAAAGHAAQQDPAQVLGDQAGRHQEARQGRGPAHRGQRQ